MGLVAVVAGGIGGGAEESRFLASLGMTMTQFVGSGELGRSMLRHYKAESKTKSRSKPRSMLRHYKGLAVRAGLTERPEFFDGGSGEWLVTSGE